MNSETKHTPLYVGAMNDGLFIIDQPPRPSNDDRYHERTGVNIVAKMAGSDSDAMARAHLLAAAPDLFEALRECEDWFDQRADADTPYGADSPYPNEEMKMLIAVRAALSKAGGQNV